MPTIGIIGLLAKAVRLLPDLLPPEIQEAPEFTFDALLCISIARSISEGKHEQSRLIALTAFAYLSQVVGGGITLWEGSKGEVELERAVGLGEIAEVLEEAGLAASPLQYRQIGLEWAAEPELVPAIVDAALENHEFSASEEFLEGAAENAAVIEDEPLSDVLTNVNVRPGDVSLKLCQNFLKAFIVSHGRSELGRMAISILAGTAGWPGKEIFAKRLSQAGHEGFARVCLALEGE